MATNQTPTDDRPTLTDSVDALGVKHDEMRAELGALNAKFDLAFGGVEWAGAVDADRFTDQLGAVARQLRDVAASMVETVAKLDKLTRAIGPRK